MPLRDFFKILNCCTGSGTNISNVPSDEFELGGDRPVQLTERERGAERKSVAPATQREPETNEGYAPRFQLFPNAQGFSMHHTQFNTTIQPSNKPARFNALDLLLANSAPSATYDSKERSRFDTPKCDKDTRVGLIEEIMDWSQSEEIPSKVLCMTGSAGSGKSALAQTISETCFLRSSPRCPGASFFFSIADPHRNHPDRFVGSLAHQISESIDEVEAHIFHALEKDSTIFEKSLGTQAEVLLINPLLKAVGKGWQPSPPPIIVVDGLDECRGEENQAKVLGVLHSLARNGLPFRIFVTSRPEYAIRSALASTGQLSRAYHIILNEHNATEDIRLFLRRKLREIGRTKGDGNWPPEMVLEILVEGASGQFIHAATVVKYIADRRRSRTRSLATVLDWISNSRNKRSKNPFAVVDDLYTNILSTAQATYEDAFDGEGECPRLVHSLMSYILISDVTTLETSRLVKPSAVEHLLEWDDDECDRILDDLHSVVRVKPYPGRGMHLSFYHKSFLDYLLDPSRCNSFYVSPEVIFADLTIKALNHVYNVDVDYIRALDEVSLGLWRDEILESSLNMALLAWPLFLNLVLIADLEEAKHSEVCEAVVRLSEGAKWKKLKKIARSGFPSAKEFMVLRLLQPSTSRDCCHSTLALCQSYAGATRKSIDLREFQQPQSVPVNFFRSVLFYPLRAQLKRRRSAIPDSAVSGQTKDLNLD